VDFSLNARFVAEHIEPNRDGEVTVWYEIARVGPPGKTSYSQARVFSVGEDTSLIEEITDFEDGTFGGWEPGPATEQRDWSVRLLQNNRRLFNNTYSNKSEGIVLKKTIANLKVGQRYEFSIKAIRDGHWGTAPSLSLSTSQGSLTQPTPLTSTWEILSGTFTAATRLVEFRINSHVSTGDGNDYGVDDLTIKRVP